MVFNLKDAAFFLFFFVILLDNFIIYLNLASKVQAPFKMPSKSNFLILFFYFRMMAEIKVDCTKNPLHSYILTIK